MQRMRAAFVLQSLTRVNVFIFQYFKTLCLSPLFKYIYLFKVFFKDTLNKSMYSEVDCE